MKLTLSLTTLLLFVSVLPASHAEPLTLEDVNMLKQVTAARMSPAGDQIAYLLQVPREIYRDADGPAYHELHVTDLEGNSKPYVTGDIDITDIAWAIGGESIFFLAKRDAEADFNALYRIRVDGGEAEQLFTHVNAIQRIHPSPDGSSVAFTATDAPPEKFKELQEKGFRAVVYEESVLSTKVWMLDLETLEAQAHELPGSASDFAWSSDGGRYAVALAPTPLVDDSFTSRDIYVVDTGSAKVQGKMGSIGKLGPFAFSPDGERIAYIGSVDINDPSPGRLYVTSSSGGERREVVPELSLIHI